MKINQKIIFYTLISFFVVLRFVYLDQDIHSRMIEGVNQLDEVYYNYAGCDYYLDSQGRTNNFLEGKTQYLKALTLTHALPSYLSLKILGNNFYGFRLSAVLASLLIIFLLYHTIKDVMDNQLGITTSILFLIFSDFYFFIFSRLQTPQIYSILLISFFLYLFYKYYDKFNYKQIFILSLVASYSVFFVYLLNFFLLASWAVYVVLLSFRQKNIKPIIIAFSGVCFSFIFFLLAFNLVGEDPMVHYNRVIEFNERAGAILTSDSAGITVTLKKYLSSIFSIFITNILRFNPILLWGVITFLIYYLWKIIYNRKDIDLKYSFIFILLILFFAQNTIISSYPFMKLIVMLPIAYISLVLSLNYLFLKKIPRVILWSSACLSLLLSYYSIKINHSQEYWGVDVLGYYDNISSIYVIITYLIFIIFVIYTLLNSSKIFPTYTMKWIINSFALLFTLMEFDYFVITPDFTTKNTLIKYSTITNNNIVAGGVSKAFQFYSNSKNVGAPYFIYENDKKAKDHLQYIAKNFTTYRIEQLKTPKMNTLTVDSIVTLDEIRYIVLKKEIQPQGKYAICLLKDIENK